MKLDFFYRYQAAELALITSIRTIGILFAWVMIDGLGLVQDLGEFIALSWLCQVLSLLIFGRLSSRSGLQFDNKHLLLLFCFLTVVGLLALFYSQAIWLFATIFIITSVFAILLTPLGNALATDLYAGVDKAHAFKVRGFVGSVNTILAPVLSGFVIYYLSRQQILFLCLSVALLSLYAFFTIKLPKASTNTADTHAVNVLKVLIFNPVERIMATVSAVANFSVTPILAYVIPYKISQEFSLPVLYVGISEGFFGLGMIMGSAWLLAVFNRYLGKHHTVAVSTALFALGIVMTALSQNVAVLAVSMFVLGLAVVMFNINSTAIRCTATPKALTQSFEFVFLAVCIIPIPLGVMATTWALSGGYLLWLYMATAVIVLLLSGVIYFHQQIKQVYRLTADKLPNFYQRQYPRLYLGMDTAQP